MPHQSAAILTRLATEALEHIDDLRDYSDYDDEAPDFFDNCIAPLEAALKTYLADLQLPAYPYATSSDLPLMDIVRERGAEIPFRLLLHKINALHRGK
jgi:hypothetical protein